MSSQNTKQRASAKSSLKRHWKNLGSWLQVLDFWRLVVAFGLACGTFFLLRQQFSSSGYSAWREIQNVAVEIPRSGLGVDVSLDDRPFTVDLMVTVDLLHLGRPISAGDFKISADPRRLGALIRNQANADGLDECEVVYHVEASDVLVKPDGVEIREIKSDDLHVVYEPMVTKEVPVRLSLDRRHQEEGWSYDCRLIQEIVVVHGPASQVKRIDSVTTEPVELQETQAYSGMVALQVPPGFADVHFSRSKVEYKVVPEKETMEDTTRAFNNVQVVFLTRGDSTLRPRLPDGIAPRRNVHLQGPSKVLKSLTPEQLQLVCDLTPYTMEGGHKVRLQPLWLPEGVQVVEIFPEPDLTVELTDLREGGAR